MNEVWNLGPQKLRPPAAAAGWRAIGVDMRLREACLSTPQPLRHRLPCVCLVGAGYPRCSRPIRSRRTGLVPFIPAGGGALYPAARTVNQQVEVLHFMGGENSPRRVLCPWRVHRLAWPAPCRPLLERRPGSWGESAGEGRGRVVQGPWQGPSRTSAASLARGRRNTNRTTEKDKKKEKGQPTNTCSTDVDMQRRQFQPN
jgi:hypothetical protein